MDKLKSLFDKLADYRYLLQVLSRNREFIPEENWDKELEQVSARLFPTFMQTEIFDGKEYVYVLRLMNDKYYVGWTEHFLDRMKDHFLNGGSLWTKKYKPIEVVKMFRGNKLDEDRETLTMMMEHGIENVRGGKWCATTKEYNFDVEKTLRSISA